MDNDINASRSADKQIEKEKRIKRIKRKLPAALLAGFSLPLSLFVFGPFELFASNNEELIFSLGDFMPWLLLLTVASGAVLSFIPLLLRRKVYYLYTALLGWLSVMLFLQGNYLNFGLTSLAGDGVGAEIPTATVVINALIWLLTLGAVIFATLRFKPVRQKLRMWVSLALALTLVMQSAGATALAITEKPFSVSNIGVNSREASGQKFLTTQGLCTLSEDGNIVVFIVDRFDTKYYSQAKSKAPEIFSELDGFTHFSDYISLYARTYPAVVSMLTGVENDFSGTRKDYFKKAYGDAEELRYLADKGYSVNIYTDSYYCYDNASVMEEYTDNVTENGYHEVSDRWGLSKAMLKLSLYRYLPFVLKRGVDDISTTTFNKYVEYVEPNNIEKYSCDMKTVYGQLTAEDFELRDGKQFSFIHIDGCHLPTKYDENFEEIEPASDAVSAMKQSFKIINRYISEMKRLGVYEDATIIITGDHAAAISDRKDVEGSRVTALLVKPSGASGGGITENSAKVCQADLWTTLFDSEGLDDAPNTDGISVLDADQNGERIRKYLFQRSNDASDEIVEYEIRGNANDFSNWYIKKRTQIGDIYK